MSGSEITILGSARVKIEIPAQKTGDTTRLGVCTRLGDGLTDSNILSLKDLKQVQIEVGRLTIFRFPGGWEHVVRSDLREITLEVGVRNANSGTRGHEAQDKDKGVCRMLTDSESGRFEWTDKYGNEWITDKVIEKWVDRRYPDVGIAYFYYKDKGFILTRDIENMRIIDQRSSDADVPESRGIVVYNGREVVRPKKRAWKTPDEEEDGLRPSSSSSGVYKFQRVAHRKFPEQDRG